MKHTNKILSAMALLGATLTVLPACTEYDDIDKMESPNEVAEFVPVSDARELGKLSSQETDVSGTIPVLAPESMQLAEGDESAPIAQDKPIFLASAAGLTLYDSGQFDYESGIWGTSYDQLVSGSCPGYKRTSAEAYAVNNNGGYCTFDRWYSQDTSDCRFWVHVGAKAYKNGTCVWLVYADEESLPSYTRTLWLSADEGVTSINGKVTNWADQDDSNNHAYMATAARQPTLITNALNGKPVLRFNGAQSMTLTNKLSHSNFTVFVAGKNSHPSSFSMILGPLGTGLNGNNQLRWENGTQALLVGLGNNMPIVTATVGNTKVYHALSARYDGSQLKVYRDGNLVSTSSFVTNGPWELNQIGAWMSQYFMVGDLAELVFYSSALSESNRITVNGYLKAKYALP